MGVGSTRNSMSLSRFNRFRLPRGSVARVHGEESQRPNREREAAQPERPVHADHRTQDANREPAADLKAHLRGAEQTQKPCRGCWLAPRAARWSGP